MIAAIYEFLLNRPNLLRKAGCLLWRCGSFGIFTGLLAKSINVILLVIASLGAPNQQVDYQTLFPGIPVWWVPESVFGLAIYVGMMLAGYSLLTCAAQLQRLLRST
jgi:hypothetical protein